MDTTDEREMNNGIDSLESEKSRGSLGNKPATMVIQNTTAADSQLSNKNTVAVITLPDYNSSLRGNSVEVDLPDDRDLNRRKSVDSSNSIGIATLDGGRFDAYSKVSLTWQNIAVDVDVTESQGCCKKSLTKKLSVLKGVSGLVEPGQFMAIMGASGAGKTTLLNTLAFRNAPKLKCSGDISVNGMPISKSQMKLISAYVQQEDYFIGTLKVFEVMMFHANLRMDKSISVAEKKKKVEATLTALGLQKVKNSYCGLPDGSIRGISGGERKRLSVATELLMDPPLLFIDEPTSGLDAFMAESIVKLIRKLAEANRSILCTIHQPTSEVFALFDRVCLVAEGETAFIGPSEQAQKFFAESGHSCPPNFNPADHYIFTLAIRPGNEEKCREKCKAITGYYQTSEYYKNVTDKIADIHEKADKSIKTLSREKVQSPLWRQIGENFKRSFLNTVRNPGYTRSRIGQCFVIALLAGLAYYQTSNVIDPSNGEYLSTVSQNKSGVLFFFIISLTFGTVFIQCLTIPMELPVVRREYQNGMYSTLPYFISKLCAEIPFLIILPLIQVSISYFMIGLRAEVDAFFICVVTCVCVAWGSTGLGWFIAAWTGDLTIAGAVAAPIIMPFFLFGGLFQSQSSTPYYFYPIKWASWFRYGYTMLMVNELKDLELECIDYSPCPNGTIILEQFGIDPNELWWPNIFGLLMFGAILCFFAWSCLLCRVRR